MYIIDDNDDDDDDNENSDDDDHGIFLRKYNSFLEKKNQALMNDCFKLHFVNRDEGPPLIRVKFYYIC